jgi:hypothetical protein
MRWLVGVWMVLGGWSLAWADFYAQCPDGQGGFVWRLGGCAGQTQWELRATRDPRTAAQQCILFSPAHAVPVTPQDRALIRLVLAVSRPQEPVATLLSAGTAWGARATFHQDTQGVGLWVEGHPFLPVDLHSHAAGLGWFVEHSQALVRQLQTGTAVHFRVRLWPAPQTFEGAIPLAGFAAGYAALTRCAEEGRTAR